MCSDMLDSLKALRRLGCSIHFESVVWLYGEICSLHKPHDRLSFPVQWWANKEISHFQ